GVQDGAYVIHAGLERREMATEVGQARAALVEKDQPERLRQPLVEGTQLRDLPAVDEVRDPAGHAEQVGLALPDDLVRDREAAAPGVADVEAHAHESPRLAPWRQPSWNESSSSAASGSRLATGSRFARPTRARLSGGSRRPARKRRSARSTPPKPLCASRCRPTSAPRSSCA